MARIEKYSSGIMGVIKHNIREFKDGICPTNSEVDPARKNDNYSLIRRGNNAVEIDRYRRKIEKECFKYKRKNLVHANEVICTLPADCPPEQERLFFEETFNYICSTLPMGKKCVFLAEIHADEGRIFKDGNLITQGRKHLHVMYIPAVPDSKHEGYDFRLSSYELTKLTVLKKWHSNYQKWLDNAGVKATVSSGTTTGKGISVKSLKEISKVAGLSLEKIQALEAENQYLRDELEYTKTELAESYERIKTLEEQINNQEKHNEWGSVSSWHNSWNAKQIEEEHTW